MTGTSTIDRFAVLDHLADGSFGPIHMGKDPSSDQKVVIKLCTVEDQGLRQRFFTEAEMATKLKHTHVVDVLAAGFQGETPYLVQEYLEGYDLEEIISQRRTWRGTDKLAVLMHVAQGMAYAHSQGVSHHDLKPANVRISGGVAKVVDFGTSRLASTETRTTQRGVTLATASYLPPEQVRSGDLDHRVDVFAFGSLAYELFTYQRPFRGQTLSALVYQILYKDPVPMASVWPDCPAPLNKLLTTCLAKDRELRYAGFPQVLAVLQSLHDEAAAGKHPALTVAVTAVPEPEPEEDVMSQSMVTRTAATVGSGGTMTSAAATQRIQKGSGPAEMTPTEGASAKDASAEEAAGGEPPESAPSRPSTGSPAETVKLAALPDDDDDSEDATVIMDKAVPPRPKVGATTRTEQPPDIPERPKVGATTRTEQPPDMPTPEPTAPPPAAPEPAAPEPAAPEPAAPAPKVGATTRTKQPTVTEEAESSQEPASISAEGSGKSTATRHVESGSKGPIATMPTTQRPEEQAGPEASAEPPQAEPSDTPSKPFNTGKLALSAQEISALVAQGKLEEAQKHLQAMQQGAVDAAELPTTPMQRADGGASRPATPPTPSSPAAPPPSTPPPATPESAAPPPPTPLPDTPKPAVPPPAAASPAASASPPSPSTPSPPSKPGASPKAPPSTQAPPKPPTQASAAPGQKTLDRSSAPPSPAPKAKGRGGPPVALLVGAGAAILLLLAGAGWWFFGRAQPEAPPPVAEVPKPRAAPPAAAGEAVETGQILVDASPWGTLTEITDDSGYLVDLPTDTVTPLVLDLPVGTYNLVLSRGAEAAAAADDAAPDGLDSEALGELQSCEVEVTLDLPATCRVRFAPPSVTEYFKDAGWWQ